MRIEPEHLRTAALLGPFDDEEARLGLAHPHRRRYDEPERYRDAAVLAAFFAAPDGPRLVLARRTLTVEHHRGQIAFPGGAVEEGETLLEAALREAREEVGIDPADAVVLGRLVPLRIPVSGFEVHPFVAWLPRRPDYVLDPGEVAEVIEVPLPLLLDERNRREREVTIHGRVFRVPVYDLPGVEPPPLWGATAMMLAGLIERLRAVLQSAANVSESASEAPSR